MEAISTLMIAAALAAATPTPTPAPAAGPRLIAALESEQGEGSERIALFDDCTLINVVGYRGRSRARRKLVSTNERDLMVRVFAEAAAEAGERDFTSSVVGDAKARRFRLQIGEGKGARVFLFDDVSPLPLSVGRARGALQDMQSRFYRPEDQKQVELWDPSRVRAGDLLRRKGDGLWFEVVREDTFENNLEVRSVNGGGLRFFLERAQLPRMFENPAGDEEGEISR